jgi:RNA polymerase sigma-70 factor (family 1)
LCNQNYFIEGMPEYTDNELINSIRLGDETAFSVFYKQYYRKLLVLVLFLTRSEELAEDIVQESFTKLWKKRESLNEEGCLKVYIRSIARNLVFDHSRKMKVRSRYEQKNLEEPLRDSTTEHIHHKELELTLTEALSQLPQKKQDIFRMSRFENKTYAEIAKHLQTTPKAVERHMARSVGFIRKYIMKHAGFYIVVFLLRRFL